MLTVKVDDHEVSQLFDSLKRKMGNMTSPLNEIGAIGYSSIIKNFEVGGRYGEIGSWRGGLNRWKPLKAQTLMARNTRWAVHKNKKGEVTSRGWKTKPEKLRKLGILQVSGRLRNSITWKASADHVIWGTNVVYAGIQHHGGKTKAHVIRARHKKALAWPGGPGPVKSVKHPGSTIPARPFLVLQDDDILEIKRVMQRFLMAA